MGVCGWYLNRCWCCAVIKICLFKPKSEVIQAKWRTWRQCWPMSAILWPWRRANAHQLLELVKRSYYLTLGESTRSLTPTAITNLRPVNRDVLIWKLQSKSIVIVYNNTNSTTNVESSHQLISIKYSKNRNHKSGLKVYSLKTQRICHKEAFFFHSK